MVTCVVIRFFYLFYRSGYFCLAINDVDELNPKLSLLHPCLDIWKTHLEVKNINLSCWY